MRRLMALVTSLLIAALVPASPASAHGDDGRDRPDRFPDRIDLPLGYQPEGITTGRGTTVYVGSLADGAVVRVNVRTGSVKDFVAGEQGNVAVGVEYDRRRKLVWVAGGATGTVTAYDAKSGEEVATYAFEGTGFLNDLVVTRDAVYVTDSNNAHLAVVPFERRGRLPDPDDVELLPLVGDFELQQGFNANGIVADGDRLVLVQSNTGFLFRVDPSDDEADTRRIRLEDDYLVTFGDGLELRGDTLYVVRNQLNLVAVLDLNRRLTRGELEKELTEESFDVPTTITVAAGRLWAVNARFGTPPTPQTEYWITQVSKRRDHRD